MDMLICLGFCGYFLMVCDLMNYSCEIGIFVGSGCGFFVGFLVVWCIGIINVDLICYGFLFECFINFECFDLLDVDLDFSQVCCYEVIEYLNECYGEDYVVGILNFIYLGVVFVLCDIVCIYGVEFVDMVVLKELKNVEDDSFLLEELCE